MKIKRCERNHVSRGSILAVLCTVCMLVGLIATGMTVWAEEDLAAEVSMLEESEATTGEPGTEERGEVPEENEAVTEEPGTEESEEAPEESEAATGEPGTEESEEAPEESEAVTEEPGTEESGEAPEESEAVTGESVTEENEEAPEESEVTTKEPGTEESREAPEELGTEESEAATGEPAVKKHTVQGGEVVNEEMAAQAAPDTVTVQRIECGEFRSKGAIRYRDAGGQEVILDARDLETLFQYAAKGKSGLSQALSGVGTKLIKDGDQYCYTRDPQVQDDMGEITTVEQLQDVCFDLLLQALADSQKLPAGYEEQYTLASSDNLTLGRAAWSDGSLLRGNNRDLTDHYIRGWLEGSGCEDYEAVYDEEGRWIGYRGK